MSRVFALAHGGLFKEVLVTTHPHAEAARQYLAAKLDPQTQTGLVVIAPEDLDIPGPSLVNLHNFLTNSAVKKFETKSKGQLRVFAELVKQYGSKEQEPFNPAETPAELQDKPQGAEAKEDSSEGSNSTEEATMAKKKKVAKKKVKGDRKPRVSAPLYGELGAGSKPAADMTCGCYIRSLIMAGTSTDKILAKVKTHYPDSSAKASDVSWNKGKLKAAGKKIPTAE